MPAVETDADDMIEGDGGYGPLLHRWGNTFPSGDALVEEEALYEGEGVGFFGDYTETVARMGSVESALLSGTLIGERIVRLVNSDVLQD